MTVAVNMISDLVRNIAAGQNLINILRPEPPKVQFYNIRLGLGSSLNNSDPLPSVIATDIANTQFFAKFEEVSSVPTKPRRSYQDISMSFLGARGSGQKRTDSSEDGEVAVQTTPPSNGFSLKSVDLQGGSESLCISNFVIKGSNAQSREEIFIPIGDLGFLCGRKWNWGSVLGENRQRCIWLDGQPDKNDVSVNLLHLDIQKMANIFQVDKNDELKRTDLSTACTYLSNSREIDVLNSRYSGSAPMNSQFEDSIEEVTLQQAISDLYNENQNEDQSRADDIIVGEMRTEDLFAKKQVVVDQQDISDIIDGSDVTPENLLLTEKIIEVEKAFADEQSLINEEISEEILDEAESQAEESLFIKQVFEKERLLEDEIVAETLLAQQAENVSPEEMLELKLNLVGDELEAEEELAEKSLAEEEMLAKQELAAEENLAVEILSDQERIAEEALIEEEALAEERLAETFTEDTPYEERLEAETELLEAEIAAEEDLLAREISAERNLDEKIFRAEQDLVENEIFAEKQLEEEEMMQREALSDQIINEQVLSDLNDSDQQSQQGNIEDWLEGQDISEEQIDEFFPQEITEEEFTSLPNFSEMMDEEIYDDDIFQKNAQDWLDEQELINESLNKEQSFAGQVTGEIPENLTADKVIKGDQTNAEVVAGISELKKRQTFTV